MASREAKYVWSWLWKLSYYVIGNLVQWWVVEKKKIYKWDPFMTSFWRATMFLYFTGDFLIIDFWSCTLGYKSLVTLAENIFVAFVASLKCINVSCGEKNKSIDFQDLKLIRGFQMCPWKMLFLFTVKVLGEGHNQGLGFNETSFDPIYSLLRSNSREFNRSVANWPT